MGPLRLERCARVGVGDNGEGAEWVGVSILKNRPSHHKYKSPKQFM